MRKLMMLMALLAASPAVMAISENDFAYSADIQTSENRPFYRFVLPDEVVSTIYSQNLGDMQVINADNQVVPHMIQAIPQKTTYPEVKGTVAIFPLYLNREKNSNDLKLKITRNESGEVIDIGSAARPVSADSRLNGYLLDLRQWQKPVQALHFYWNNGTKQSFIRKLNIYSSADLQHWRLVASNKPLVHLTYNNQLLSDNTIRVNIAKSNYLKLEFADSRDDLAFSRVDVSYKPQAIAHYPQQWKPVNLQRSNQPGVYRFHYGLKMPLQKIKIKLPEQNTVVQTRIYSRASEQQPWHQRSSVMLYRIKLEDTELEKTTISLYGNYDHDWKIVFDQSSGGIGDQLPKLEVAWQPRNVVFVARGQPPFKLLWGSSRVGTNQKNIQQLLSLGNKSTLLGEARLVTSSIRKLNTAALKPQKPERNWQKWILWISLVAASILLVFMALGLVKKMNDEDG